MSNNEPYSFICKREPTEDGDYIFTREIRAFGFAGIREWNSNYAKTPITEWTGCGDGWLKAHESWLVDGAVVAIEASNDYWASMRDPRGD